MALADKAGLAAFETAAAPILTQLEANPTTADLISQIREPAAPDNGPQMEAC